MGPARVSLVSRISSRSAAITIDASLRNMTDFPQSLTFTGQVLPDELTLIPTAELNRQVFSPASLPFLFIPRLLAATWLLLDRLKIEDEK